jgi:putative oxidoreductase
MMQEKKEEPMSRLSGYQNAALFALRLFAGLLFLEHGLNKLFGIPHSELPQPATFTLVWWAGVIELVAGFLLTAGIATRLVAFLACGEMAVAYFIIHAPAGPFPISNKGELAILYSFIFLYFAVVGGGAWSVDAMLERNRGRETG